MITFSAGAVRSAPLPSKEAENQFTKPGKEDMKPKETSEKMEYGEIPAVYDTVSLLLDLSRGHKEDFRNPKRLKDFISKLGKVDLEMTQPNRPANEILKVVLENSVDYLPYVDYSSDENTPTRLCFPMRTVMIDWQGAVWVRGSTHNLMMDDYGRLVFQYDYYKGYPPTELNEPVEISFELDGEKKTYNLARSFIKMCATKLPRGYSGIAVEAEGKTYYVAAYNDKTVTIYSPLAIALKSYVFGTLSRLSSMKTMQRDINHKTLIQKFTLDTQRAREVILEGIRRDTLVIKSKYRSLQSIKDNDHILTEQYKNLAELVSSEPDVHAAWLSNEGKLLAIVGPITVKYTPKGAKTVKATANMGYFAVSEMNTAFPLSLVEGMHPNINSGDGWRSFCFGNNSGMIAKLVGQGSLTGAVKFFISCLQNANDDGYSKWDNHPKFTLNDWKPNRNNIEKFITDRSNGWLWRAIKTADEKATVDLNKKIRRTRKSKEKKVQPAEAEPVNNFTFSQNMWPDEYVSNLPMSQDIISRFGINDSGRAVIRLGLDETNQQLTDERTSITADDLRAVSRILSENEETI